MVQSDGLTDDLGLIMSSLSVLDLRERDLQDRKYGQGSTGDALGEKPPTLKLDQVLFKVR